MSKALVAIGVTASVTAIAVPTSLLVGGSSAQDIIYENGKPNWKSKKIPRLTSASDIQNKYLQVSCLKDYFKSINWSSSDISTTNPNGEAGAFSVSVGSYLGCLMVEYIEQMYEGDKWWGEFNLVWSFSDGKHGLVTTVNAKVEEGKLKASSAAYWAEYSDNKWKAKYKKEKQAQEITSSTELDKIIPKAGSAITDNNYKSNYWGFNPQLDKICGTNDCSKPNGNLTSKAAVWELKTGGSTKIETWCENLNNWFNDSFGWTDFTSKMSSITGTWSLLNG